LIKPALGVRRRIQEMVKRTPGIIIAVTTEL